MVKLIRGHSESWPWYIHTCQNQGHRSGNLCTVYLSNLDIRFPLINSSRSVLHLFQLSPSSTICCFTLSLFLARNYSISRYLEQLYMWAENGKLNYFTTDSFHFTGYASPCVRTQECADENSTFYRDAARDNCQQRDATDDDSCSSHGA